MSEKRQISKEGLQKYEDELTYLKGEAREMIAQKIKEAREQGDLSENAEYDAAKDEQRDIEARITEIEEILKNVEVIDKGNLKKGVIGVGCRVTLRDLKEKDKKEKEDKEKSIVYDIVGATEADSLNNKISCESPLGKELIGKKKGDKVKIPLAHGKLEYEVLKVSQ